MKISEMINALSVTSLKLYHESLEKSSFVFGGDGKLYKELTNFKVGDLVMEISTKSFKPASLRIGRLLKIGTGKEPFKEYVIKNAYGKKITWSNCEFIKILELKK